MIFQLLSKPARTIGCNSIDSEFDQPDCLFRVVHRPDVELLPRSFNSIGKFLIHSGIMNIKPVEALILYRLDKLRIVRNPLLGLLGFLGSLEPICRNVDHFF